MARVHIEVTTWASFVDRYRHLLEEESQIRSERRGLEQLSKCRSEQLALIAEAASKLPTSGPSTEALEHGLLVADLESPDHLLALRALEHRKQFPKRYLRAHVRAGLRHGTRGVGVLAVASAAYGFEPVVRELLEAAREGQLSYDTARWLLGSVSRPKWMTTKPAHRALTRAEHDLVAELIRVTSDGKVRWLRARPPDDE